MKHLLQPYFLSFKTNYHSTQALLPTFQTTGFFFANGTHSKADPSHYLLRKTTSHIACGVNVHGLAAAIACNGATKSLLPPHPQLTTAAGLPALFLVYPLLFDFDI